VTKKSDQKLIIFAVAGVICFATLLGCMGISFEIFSILHRKIALEQTKAEIRDVFNPSLAEKKAALKKQYKETMTRDYAKYKREDPVKFAKLEKDFKKADAEWYKKLDAIKTDQQFETFTQGN